MKAKNHERANRARVALRTHVKASSEQYEESLDEITDLITNLLHLKTQMVEAGEDDSDVLASAKMHHEAEQAGVDDE